MLGQPFGVRRIGGRRNDLLEMERLIGGKGLDCGTYFDLPFGGIYAEHAAIEECVEIAAKQQPTRQEMRLELGEGSDVSGLQNERGVRT